MPSFRWLRKLSCPDVYLERLVEQSWLCQFCVSLLPQRHKLLLSDTVPQVFVLALVILHTQPRYRGCATLRWIIMACPDFYVVRQTKKLTPGVEEAVCTSAREVATRSTDIRVE